MNYPRKYFFYILVLTSSILYAIISGIDATVNTLFITNPFILGFSIFFVGIFISLLFAGILSIPINGKSIGHRYFDPSFKRLRWIQKKEIKYHVLAGIGNATYTIGYFTLFTILDDPSVVLPFTQIVILYLIIIESFNEKNAPTLIEIQAGIMVTIGALIGSLNLTGSINVMSLLIVFAILIPAWALLTIYQQKLKHLQILDNQNDAVNIRFWNVIISFALLTFIMFFYDIITANTFLIDGIIQSFTYLGWISLIAGGMFFVYILYIRALGIGKASVTQAIRSTIIIFTIPVSLVLSNFSIIPLFSTDPISLMIKISGIILIVIGIISYALTQVKAYIFVTIEPKVDIKKIMCDFWKIRGITHVSATTGTYDMIIKIQTRTLLKGYERIIKKVENIKGVQTYRWESVLKEWERI